ncbi:hypothetical protein K432DRAFT_422726 [Lepidopterella palustris CBS 459.81]|uniref:Uncharacterized protein n=1 Tax=Lepidopterella palustris CBS 459.81 TaxID=1314670 RepID=A0A8E2JJE4_9PEZI|nr:hypothetical protein K432DRAFT_422726 [Lepidopterella palustris CBS 459.81]
MPSNMQSESLKNSSSTTRKNSLPASWRYSAAYNSDLVLQHTNSELENFNIDEILENFPSEDFVNFSSNDVANPSDDFSDLLADYEPSAYTNTANRDTVIASCRASAQMAHQPYFAVPRDATNYEPGLYQSAVPTIDPQLLDPLNPQDSAYVTAQLDQPAPQACYTNSTTYIYDGDLEFAEQTHMKPQADARTFRHNSDAFGQNVDASRKTSSGSTSSSNFSDHSQLNKARRAPTKNVTATYRPEKPTKNDDTPWVRTNAITKGETTRTGKINQYDPKKVYVQDLPHPLGTWSGSQTEFRYSMYGELSERTYSVKQIQEFLFEHPRTKDCRLKLWIQKAPTDSARRYKSPTHSDCRFRDCPVQKHLRGSITHGHYRVAFDENWRKYGQNADPFLAAGYVHLYCLERFLDFPEIVQFLDVEADTRQLVNEPKQRFAATLSESVEASVASRFIEACKSGNLLELYPNYPNHAEYQNGAKKPHEDTLTYALHVAKEETRPPAQLRQFQNRGLTGSHIVVHKGDLEMFCAQKTKQRTQKWAKRKRTEVEDSNADGVNAVSVVESDEEEEREEVKRPRKRRNAASKAGPKAHKGPFKGRKSPAPTRDQPRQQNLRSKTRVNYPEEVLIPSTLKEDGLIVLDDPQTQKPRSNPCSSLMESDAVSSLLITENNFQRQHLAPILTQDLDIQYDNFPSPFGWPPLRQVGQQYYQQVGSQGYQQVGQQGSQCQQAGPRYHHYEDTLNYGIGRRKVVEHYVYDPNQWNKYSLRRRPSRFNVARCGSSAREVISRQLKDSVISTKATSQPRRRSARLASLWSCQRRLGSLGSIFTSDSP